MNVCFEQKPAVQVLRRGAAEGLQAGAKCGPVRALGQAAEGNVQVRKDREVGNTAGHSGEGERGKNCQVNVIKPS